MEEINGSWTIFGIDEASPECLHTISDLVVRIDEVGFLPLFKTEIDGFSVEEYTAAKNWWGEDPALDPWEWRAVLAAEGNIAYGKFFGKRAGFVSREWLPYFANLRRDGYDFDALWDDEKASRRSKLVMDLFTEEHADDVLFSNEIKEKAGFGKGGEKGFEGVMTALQMQFYLCVREFRRRKNKKGQEYGWAVAKYCTPEHLFGRATVTKAYAEDPKESMERIVRHMQKLYPNAEEAVIRKMIRG